MNQLKPEILACISRGFANVPLLLAVLCLAGCNSHTNSANGPANDGPLQPAVRSAASDQVIPGSSQHPNVVYLCQASGSMLECWGVLKNGVKESVSALDPNVRFNVILMCDAQTLVLFNNGCQLATEKMKQRASSYMDNAFCSGRCSLSDGAKAASRMQPDNLFLISNGYFSADESPARALSDFQPVFSNPGTKVNCILIPTRQDVDVKAILAAIAEHGHGKLLELKQN